MSSIRGEGESHGSSHTPLFILSPRTLISTPVRQKTDTATAVVMCRVIYIWYLQQERCCTTLFIDFILSYILHIFKRSSRLLILLPSQTISQFLDMLCNLQCWNAYLQPFSFHFRLPGLHLRKGRVPCYRQDICKPRVPPYPRTARPAEFCPHQPAPPSAWPTPGKPPSSLSLFWLTLLYFFPLKREKNG